MSASSRIPNPRFVLSPAEREAERERKRQERAERKGAGLPTREQVNAAVVDGLSRMLPAKAGVLSLQDVVEGAYLALRKKGFGSEQTSAAIKARLQEKMRSMPVRRADCS